MESNEKTNRGCRKSSTAAWIAIGLSALVNIIAAVGFVFSVRSDIAQARHDISAIFGRLRDKRVDEVPFVAKAVEDHESRIRKLEHK